MRIKSAIIGMISAAKLQNLRIFVTPSGAVAVIICFFLPWVKLSCLGTHSYSGAQLGGWFWLVPAAGIVSLISFFLFRYLRRLTIARSITTISSIVALTVIVIECLVASGGRRILLVTVRPEHLHPSIKIGGIGTIIGLLLMLFDAQKMRFGSSQSDQVPGKSPDKPLTVTK